MLGDSRRGSAFTRLTIAGAMLDTASTSDPKAQTSGCPPAISLIPSPSQSTPCRRGQRVRSLGHPREVPVGAGSVPELEADLSYALDVEPLDRLVERRDVGWHERSAGPAISWIEFRLLVRPPERLVGHVSDEP